MPAAGPHLGRIPRAGRIGCRKAAQGIAVVTAVPPMSGAFGRMDTSPGSAATARDLSIEMDPQPPCALAEGGFATLKNVADGLTNCRVFQPARHIADRRKTARRM